MKICPVCKTECGDGALYCSNCGCALPPASVNPYTPPYQSPVQQEAKDPVPPGPEPPQEAQPFQQSNTYHAPQGDTAETHRNEGQGYFSASQNGWYGDQAQGYPNAQQGNYSEQNAYPYPNMPQGGYQQPVYPNKPKKGMKGWAIGLIIGGVILLVAIIAAVCVAIFLNFDQNSVVDPSSSIESSTEDEVSFVEESEANQVIPTDPHDFNLAESNPFVTEENGDVIFTIPSLFFDASREEQNAIVEMIEAVGSEDIRFTEDGDLQVVMSKTAYNLLLESFSAGLQIGINELKNDDTFPSVTDISVNDTYTVFQVTIDRTTASATLDEYTANLTVSAIGGLYQMLAGVPADMTMVTVQFVDAATGDIYNEEETINPAQYLVDLS